MENTKDLEIDRLAALQKWATRLWQEQRVPANAEKRNAARQAKRIELVLIPFDGASFKPLLSERRITVTKDISESGVGLVSNARLTAELYFGETQNPKQLYLLKKVRERPIMGSVIEYGMRIVDRFTDFGQLVASLKMKLK